MQGKRVPVNAKQRSMPEEQDQRPKFAPSNAVHVTESAGNEHRNGRSSDFWSLRGYTLKEAFEEMYGVTGARLRMPEALETGGHFDFEIVLPVAESPGEDAGADGGWGSGTLSPGGGAGEGEASGLCG